jgi:hypothetical protein
MLCCFNSCARQQADAASSRDSCQQLRILSCSCRAMSSAVVGLLVACGNLFSPVLTATVVLCSGTSGHSDWCDHDVVRLESTIHGRRYTSAAHH